MNPLVGEILWGEHKHSSNVAISGFITGLAQTALDPEVQASFAAHDLAPGMLRATTVAVGAAVAQVTRWCDDFPSVGSVLAYLLQPFSESDVRVTVPAHEPLRVFVAAAVATIHRMPQAAELAARSATLLTPGRITDQRLDQMHRAPLPRTPPPSALKCRYRELG